MKKLLIAALFLCTAPLFSGDITIKGKVGFYMPNSQTIRDVYGGGFIYGGEAAWRVLKIFDLWGEGMYFSKGGRSLGDRHRTRIRIVPVGFGVNIVVPIANVLEVYIGGGPRYFSVKIHNTSRFIRTKESKSGWGAGGRGGVSFSFPKCFRWDFFLDYSSKELNFSSIANNTNVGGLTIATAVGYRF